MSLDPQTSASNVYLDERWHATTTVVDKIIDYEKVTQSPKSAVDCDTLDRDQCHGD